MAIEALEVKRNSWHYRLAKLSGLPTSQYDVVDICKYRVAVLTGLLASILFLVIASFVTYGLYDYITYFFSSSRPTYDVSLAGWAMAMVLFVCGAVLSVLLFMAFLFGIWNLLAFGWGKVFSKNKAPSAPGFIKASWQSFKGKYCLPVKFVDRE